jgi:hypothetical protein
MRFVRTRTLAVLLSAASDVGCSDSPCPSTQPSASAPCSTSGTLCTFGSDPRFSCRPWAQCVDNAWRVSSANDFEASCETSQACPTVQPTALEICAEAQVDLACVHPAPVYLETQSPGYTAPTVYYCGQNCGDWEPYAPPLWCSGLLKPACPTVVPNAGAQCAPEGLICQYNPTCDAFFLECEQGRWAFEAQVTCPF